MLDRFLADWPLKLLALVLAFGIWVSITGEDHTLKDFTVPVELGLREDRISATPPPTTVTVRLEGTKTAIRKLDPLRLALRLNLVDSPLGEREVQLSEPHLLGVPQGVNVAFFNPDRLRLQVDRRMRRELPVEPDFVGEPPEGLTMYGATVRPQTVLVEGPESAVSELTALRTEPIPLDRRTRAFVEHVAAVSDGPQVKVVDPAPLEVRVVVDTNPVEIKYEDVPVILAGDPSSVETTPARLAVTLSGPPGLLQGVAASQIRAVADVTDLKPSGRGQRVPIRAGVQNLSPDQMLRIRVKSVAPSEVSVRISSEKPS